jgi:hypothetical protein
MGNNQATLISMITLVTTVTFVTMVAMVTLGMLGHPDNSEVTSAIHKVHILAKAPEPLRCVYISQLVILFVVYLRHCQSLKGYSVE